MVARAADGGGEEADECLEDLELDLDALGDDLFERLENLLHEALGGSSERV